MKLHTTRKAIVQNSLRIVSVGYCDLQHLLRCIEPFAYTTGIYGWNFDAYEIDGLTICTGYRNMPGRTANNTREFDCRANAIWNDARSYTEYTYEQRRADCLALLHEFAAQA